MKKLVLKMNFFQGASKVAPDQNEVAEILSKSITTLMDRVYLSFPDLLTAEISAEYKDLSIPFEFYHRFKVRMSAQTIVPVLFSAFEIGPDEPDELFEIPQMKGTTEDLESMGIRLAGKP